MTILIEILKDSNYKLNQFEKFIPLLESKISTEQDKKGKNIYKIDCLKRGKPVNLTPEEVVRQLYLYKLTKDYLYTTDYIEVEYPVFFGVEKKRADIVIMDKSRTNTPYIIVEVEFKKPELKDGKEQLKSYCNATGAPIGVWTNGDQISYYHRKAPNYFEEILDIPTAYQTITDITNVRWTINNLVENDKLIKGRKSLKDLVLELGDEILINTELDAFEEISKLILAKLYDEIESVRNPRRQLEFRTYGETDEELKIRITVLFDRACNRWGGVFPNGSKIELPSIYLFICVNSLQDIKLVSSNLDVIDEAFEYLINKTSRGEKGQYFTPRYVIDMCVKMLNPKESETMIDTAAGSGGFTLHTIFHVWKQILEDENIPQNYLFTIQKKPVRCEDYVREKVFAIDFHEKTVRVSRILNLIADDGHTNVLHLNTLDFEKWRERTDADKDWIDTYFEGWQRLKRMRCETDEKKLTFLNKIVGSVGNNQKFKFDILMSNPPFAGDIKDNGILSNFQMGKKENGKLESAVGRDILFIERNLDFLTEGGRLAVVLPQGRFNNSSDKRIRDYIAERCRILAVVGLHGNVFKPHTGTKTSVLFLQKWTTDKDGINPKQADYPIFFATMQETSKDNSGDKIYVKNPDGSLLMDEHGHLIVKHDLFNHDGLTQDGIAEAFIEFAKKEHLSFF